MEYTIINHVHNYAVWTAARAVQRNFTNTKKIKAAIDKTELKTLIDSKIEMTNDSFDIFHSDTANKMISFFNDTGINASYGRAAKIIAVYIKTSVVIRDNESSIAKIAHPPIDNILLTRLDNIHPDLRLFGIKWTQLNEEKYFTIIDKLRTLNFDYFWEIEKYWTPIRNE